MFEAARRSKRRPRDPVSCGSSRPLTTNSMNNTLRPGRARARRQLVLFTSLAGLLGVALTAAPATSHAASSDTVSVKAKPKRGRVTDHVIVISIDGLRPDAIQ